MLVPLLLLLLSVCLSVGSRSIYDCVLPIAAVGQSNWMMLAGETLLRRFLGAHTILVRQQGPFSRRRLRPRRLHAPVLQGRDQDTWCGQILTREKYTLRPWPASKPDRQTDQHPAATRQRTDR
jgi:hypothetical protein